MATGGSTNLLRSSSQRRAAESSSALSSIPEPSDAPLPGVRNALGAPQKLRVTKLRIDAFLGEWLSPDYYEDITPPPSSVMMVAGAKAELLRPGEKIEGADLGARAQGNFPGGWTAAPSDSSSIDESEEDLGPLGRVGSLASVLPRSRSNTHTIDSRPRPRVSTNVNSSGATYVPPTPTYALAPSDPIPAGYVAHARDACVDVDYRWDSMRHHGWGHGGEYGEEWSSMHKRFRNGLQKMIGWFKAQPEEEVTEDVDTVVILITHGAGCNALIGALTNQPVLLDVGMASMTLAVRKDKSEPSHEHQSGSSSHSRRSSMVEPSLSEEYDVKLMASTDHLRGGSAPMSPAMGPSPRTPASSWRRVGSTSSADFNLEDTRPTTTQSLYRSASTKTRSHAVPPAFKTSGLWGSGTSTAAASESGDSETMPDFGTVAPEASGKVAAEAVRTPEKISNGEHTWSPTMQQRSTANQRGLWGVDAVARDSPSAKRRWTVNEQ